MQSITKAKRLKLVYEILIILLAIIAVSMAFLDLTNKISIESSKLLYYIDSSILMVFTADYIIRLALSNNKKQFLKQNIFDLFAIIPFNSMFRAFRIVRLAKIFRLTKMTRLARLIKITRLIRIITFSRRILVKVEEFIQTNGFIYVLYLTVIIVILGSMGIYYTEQGKTINLFGDAIWWSFVTTTTVGYGDISPITMSGRIIAAILMIFGIGFIGMLTGTIATYFLNRKGKNDNIEYEKKVIDLSSLTREEYKEILDYIEFVKSKRGF